MAAARLLPYPRCRFQFRRLLGLWGFTTTTHRSARTYILRTCIPVGNETEGTPRAPSTLVYTCTVRTTLVRPSSSSPPCLGPPSPPLSPSLRECGVRNTPYGATRQ
ncbi:hypothetical protein VFPFJ_06761 [Purpureocillium lilacinum]|uniref:Uncharacterized protein n=1 Tax=Purpureocillium lilacinum TaxID=33203 RepID=A0A179HD49_PURLI|nr:hypothetical protein VFPFJ_06761 [Purpureocillium lilacinum]OAQ88296.1 hypothetical protein VFPFJ_06761 [Purpureocillium lilacinum]